MFAFFCLSKKIVVKVLNCVLNSVKFLTIFLIKL